MSLLAKKSNYGSPLVLHLSGTYVKDLLQRKSTCRLQLRINEASACPSRGLRIYLILLLYPEEPKTFKTAWEYYNEGMYAATSRHTVLINNPGMEIIDRERKEEWLEQMDTILIFVCTTSI